MSTEVGISTALNMWLDYGEQLPIGTFSAGELRLVSGLAFGLYVVPGNNEHEGTTIATMAGNSSDLAAMPNGPLVRMHSACVFSELGEDPEFQERLKQTADPHDFMGMKLSPSPDCDCKAQRQAAQKRIATEGGVYFDLIEQEGRGAGLEVKRAAYKLSREEGLDTAEAYERLGMPFDARQYGHCAVFLAQQGFDRVRLLSNNPRKQKALRDAGITVKAEPLVSGVTPSNVNYLRTKRDKAGHSFPENL